MGRIHFGPGILRLVENKRCSGNLSAAIAVVAAVAVAGPDCRTNRPAVAADIHIPAAVRSPVLLGNILAVVAGHNCLDNRDPSRIVVGSFDSDRRTFEVGVIGSLGCEREEGIEGVDICRPS